MLGTGWDVADVVDVEAEGEVGDKKGEGGEGGELLGREGVRGGKGRGFFWRLRT